jgi:hypothetical protein
MSDRSESELHAAAAAAVRALSAADADLAEMRYWSDDDLRVVMRELASQEKAAIRAAIDGGRTYVVAGRDIRRVHSYDCSTLRDQIDRDRAWAPFQQDPESYRQQVAHGDGVPRMPQLLSRSQVEALSTYVPCQTCSPTLDHVRKTSSQQGTKLTSLTARHICRDLAALDGTSLGRLEAIVTTTTVDGTAVTLVTDATTVIETLYDAVRVLPAEH